MIVKNVSMEDMHKALEETNRIYDNNVIFKGIEWKGKNIKFTLTVKTSKGKGSKLSVGGLMGFGNPKKRVCAACWHVHGHFFDSLLTLNPNGIINISMTNKQIYSTSYGVIYNNWEDYNVGNPYHPVHASETCECGM